MTTIISGDGTITGLTTTGISAVQQLPAGSVLQVVSAVFGNNFSTTSASFVAAPTTASITPKFSTSKILVRVSGGTTYVAGSSGQIATTIYRNSTNLGDTNRGFMEVYSGASGPIEAPVCMEYLDSPATTSSTAYTLYAKSLQGTVYSNIDGTYQTITLMEIAG
jgi:hypothetical protein